jgi:hypothetical protein
MVTYFRKRIPGPEGKLEDGLTNQVQSITRLTGYSTWIAGSLPVGGGMPDLLLVSYEPKVHVLSDALDVRPEILACLRSLPCASLKTVVTRTGFSERKMDQWLERLSALGIVEKKGLKYSLSAVWRRILPEIIGIEAKVTNWRKCVNQAIRNHIFAHRSFVALPARDAERVFREPMITRAGIGVLSLEAGGKMQMLRDSRWRQPRVWSYYYRVAFLAAEQHNLKERKNAIHDTDRCRDGRIP